MPLEPKEYELVWLREMERRVVAGLPIDVSEMLVALREKLPRGFRPGAVDRRLLYGQGPSALGLHAVGDSGKLLPDLERAIRYIRDLLVNNPKLLQISATELSDALRIAPARAERLLEMMSSLGYFNSGGAGSPNGMGSIGLGGPDVLAEYLDFVSVDDSLAQRQEAFLPASTSPMFVPSPDPPSNTLVRGSAFILMSMDPANPSLTDVSNAIKSACEAFGLRAIRIDDVEHQDRITDRILENIESAEFIVADLSGEKPNVYYEVGYAHALGKRPILVRKTGTRLHFDLSVHNVPEYPNNTELSAILRRRLEAILGRPPRDGSRDRSS